MATTSRPKKASAPPAAVAPAVSTEQPAGPGKRRMQMTDIARMAGVSASTVSRALSGRGYVREDVAARIHAKAQELGYPLREETAGSRVLLVASHPDDRYLLPAAWLRRTVTRLCLDQLKSARRQRETYIGPWLPDPLVEEAADDDVADDSEDSGSDVPSVKPGKRSTCYKRKPCGLIKRKYWFTIAALVSCTCLCEFICCKKSNYGNGSR